MFVKAGDRMDLDALNAQAGLDVPVHLALLSLRPPVAGEAIAVLAGRTPLAACDVQTAAIFGHLRHRVVAAVWLLVNGCRDAASVDALWEAARAQDLAFIPVTAVLSLLDDQFTVRAARFVSDRNRREDGADIVKALSGAEPQPALATAVGALSWRAELLEAAKAAGVALSRERW